ncbi:MAG: hypothetical protein LIO99_13160 [Clostridiales bacterium]|nr:hypothetical protein [Clostridiales bacterium]
MENRILFRERLTELKTAAEQAGGILTQAKIREMLKDMPLTEEHFQLIYEYLAEQKIRVVESKAQAENAAEENTTEESKSTTSTTEESTVEENAAGENASGENVSEEAVPDDDDSRRSLSMYLEELETLSDANDEEEIRLIECVRNGDAAAKERLIGIYLPLICTMAEDYGEETLSSEDLIQEGNLGLLTAIGSLEQFENAAACRVHILNTVRGAMEKAMSDSRDGQKMDDGLLSRVNHLNEAVHNLERDLGHKVSAEEVSAYLEMPVEEIEDLLRVTGDQIETETGV